MPLFGRPSAEDDRKAQEWAEWFAQRNPLAIASLVLSLFSFIEFGALIIPGVAGIILGAIALIQLSRTRRAGSGDSSASESHPSQAGGLLYADDSLPEPINAAKYERSDVRVVPSQGQNLAWAGIALSALSLAIALLLYLRAFG
jgi:hypothetical protein